jgi:hypothetical protein
MEIFRQLYLDKELRRIGAMPRYGVTRPNNSACQTGYKITDKLTASDIARAPPPPYSPDLSRCNFWSFAFLKESIKRMELSTDDQIVAVIATIWRGVTFDMLQSVFQEWIQRLNRVIKNHGEYSFE